MKEREPNLRLLERPPPAEQPTDPIDFNSPWPDPSTEAFTKRFDAMCRLASPGARYVSGEEFDQIVQANAAAARRRARPHRGRPKGARNKKAKEGEVLRSGEATWAWAVPLVAHKLREELPCNVTGVLAEARHITRNAMKHLMADAGISAREIKSEALKLLDQPGKKKNGRRK